MNTLSEGSRSHAACRSFFIRAAQCGGSGLVRLGSGLSGPCLSASCVLGRLCLDAVAPMGGAFGFVAPHVDGLSLVLD